MKKLKAGNKALIDAIKYYQQGIDHFYDCINFNKSFLDADAIQFMNDHRLKFKQAIDKATKK